MAAELIVAPEVEYDLTEAYAWYEGNTLDWASSSCAVSMPAFKVSAAILKDIERCTRRIGGRWCGVSPMRSSMNTRTAWSRSIAFSIHPATRRNGGNGSREGLALAIPLP